ncbi:MAG: pyridoxamine 5'-phosphate oxidase family protein [Lachnospiraceae bacterium]|jgi:nitroimidazol reductase NimA-like FMN-containing flavoprotein (pyridoxamine 5'-phosphate oxidase superfamily)
MFREMRRFRQQLTEAECLDILSGSMRGTLALAGDDGYPYTVPIDYYYDRENGNLYFHCAPEGHKIDSIRRSDKASFNVLSEGVREQGQWWLQFDSVTVFGRIRIVGDAGLKEKELTAIGGKYFPKERSVEEAVRNSIDRVCILELTPEHITGKHVNEK